MPAKRKAKSKAKRKAKAKAHTLIVTLSNNGRPHRRAEIPWVKGRIFKLKHLAAYRDCRLWHLMPGWVVRITNGEETHETKKTT
jgi:hypothetical protein